MKRILTLGTTGFYQYLPNKKIFLIAKELADTLNQESVAVLIPNQSSIGEIRVDFRSQRPSINKLIKLLSQKLPAIYGQAFSLRLTNTCNGFANAKVVEIEWLGSKLKLKEVKNVFPTEEINFRRGKVFLISKNARIQQL